MEFSNNLIEQFVRVTNDNSGQSTDYTVQGTIVVYGDSSYVKLDGSDLLTPISTTTEVADGDRVMVRLKNHTAIVTGNISDPAVGKKRADGLASEISQTAAEIKLMVSDEVKKVEASIKLNSDSISTLVESQSGFSEFQQTVEGFSFMNKGGTVKISGGDVNLTGAITFGDLSKDVSDGINDASTRADEAYTKAESAASTAQTASENASLASFQATIANATANSAKEVADEAKALALGMDLPDYLKSTYIDSTLIMSPVIVGGSFFAVDQTAWASMTSSGFYMYTQGIADAPKFSVINNDRTIILRMGAGTYVGNTPEGTFTITKNTDSVVLTYNSGLYPGVSGNLVFDNDGQIIARRIAGGESRAATLIAKW